MEHINISSTQNTVLLNNLKVELKHLDKFYSPSDDIPKKEIIEYYLKIAPYILPHIKNKPFSMLHFPDGVGDPMFYQKQCPKNAPKWLKTIKLESSSELGYVKWCLVNNPASIIYMVNRSVLEMHTWFSRLPDLEKPDIAAIDLDPSETNSFKDVLEIAKSFRFIFERLKIYAVPKTSGKRGIHIYIPIKPMPFKDVQNYLIKLCSVVFSYQKDLVTFERMKKNRSGKIYLDCVQNAMGKTLISPYSMRAQAGFPVSAPLLWEELENENLLPQNFNIKNIFKRMEKTGDLFKDFYKKKQVLPKL
ncbi:MAG: non-homologous end-joining DNA ligase [Firmicutes bacterium]|nr:non-homologous end-joining DNA ligase [Bacillota bacterium]